MKYWIQIFFPALLLLLFPCEIMGDDSLECQTMQLNPPNTNLITFHIYSIRNNVLVSNELIKGNENLLREILTGYTYRKFDVYFHDVGSSYKDSFIITNKDNLLLYMFESPIIISVNYESFAKTQNAAISNSGTISTKTSDLLIWMQTVLNHQDLVFKLIGHGMGAIIAAETAEKAFLDTRTKLTMFVALDPEILVTNSSGLFRVCGKEFKIAQIRPSLATMVIVLHCGTCSHTPLIQACNNNLNSTLEIVDYFINGGANQPGCNNVKTCNRRKAAEIFVKINKENLQSPNPIQAKVCQNYDKFLSNNCNPQQAVVDPVMNMFQERGRNYFNYS